MFPICGRIRSWPFPAEFPPNAEVCQNLLGPIRFSRFAENEAVEKIFASSELGSEGNDFKRRSINMSAQWIPRGFHTITANIVADDAEQVVAFLKKAFGATETYRLTMSNGKIAHCELKLGDSVLNIGESMDGWSAHGLVAQIYVEDSDDLFKRAVDAGATEIMPMTDMFFGSREGRVADPFGNVWTIATLKEEVAPEEMQRRMKEQGC
jgi:PhnB protein